MNWTLVAISAYAAVAFANIVDKILVDKYIKDSSTIVLFTGSVAFVTGLVIFAIVGFTPLPTHQWIMVLAAGILLELYLLPYFHALELEDASNVVPLFQLIPVFSLLLSSIFLHEQLTIVQLLGFLLIVISGFFLSRNTTSGNHATGPVLGYMVLSSFLFAASSLLFSAASSITNLWDAIAWESIGIGFGTLCVALWPGYFRRFLNFAGKLPGAGWVALMTSEIFYVIYRLLFAAALSVGSVAIISVLGGTQPVFVLLYGLIMTYAAPKLIQEKISMKILRNKFLAIMAIGVGLVAIYVR